uniref:non-specific serine/threonine protein kinase n=1 Tax=Salix viminalis TaxID=40686 RepID=A0A6N2MFW0_SALVM
MSSWRKIRQAGTPGLMKSWEEEQSRLYIGLLMKLMELKLHGNRKTSNIERLISEASLLKSLKAEYIIKFYDFWIDDEKKNLNLITVIFVSGSLSLYCKKHKGVTTKAIKNWARQILREMVTCEYPCSECKNPGQTDKKVISGMKQFIEKCIVPASLRFPAIEFLKDQFLATEIQKIMFLFTEKNEFRLRGEKIDSNRISLTLNITGTSCYRTRKVEFSFYLDSDTAVSVAEEMAVQLELSPEDEAYNSELIETLVMKLVPGWKTSCGSIASAPDCLQSVRDEEALQSINSEISSEHGVTISSCARTNKHLGSSHCSLPLNRRMVDDGRLSEHKKPARNFVGSRFPSCTRAFPASAIHTKQKKLTI